MAKKMVGEHEVEVGWGEPPPARQTGQLLGWLTTLVDKPGEWAWRDYKGPSAAAATRSRVIKMGFEATVRDGRLYVRANDETPLPERKKPGRPAEGTNGKAKATKAKTSAKKPAKRPARPASKNSDKVPAPRSDSPSGNVAAA